jgi:hypothetical protein
MNPPSSRLYLHPQRGLADELKRFRFVFHFFLIPHRFLSAPPLSFRTTLFPRRFFFSFPHRFFLN